MSNLIGKNPNNASAIIPYYEKRILLWDAINEQIENKTWTNLRSSNEETYSHEYKNLKPDFKF